MVRIEKRIMEKQKNSGGEDEEQKLRVSSLAKGRLLCCLMFQSSVLRQPTESGGVLAVSLTDFKRAGSEDSAHLVQSCNLPKIRDGQLSIVGKKKAFSFSERRVDTPFVARQHKSNGLF